MTDYEKLFYDTHNAQKGELFTVSTRKALEAVIAAYRKDAERYRLLRGRLVSWYPGPKHYFSGEALDRRLDEEMT